MLPVSTRGALGVRQTFTAAAADCPNTESPQTNLAARLLLALSSDEVLHQIRQPGEPAATTSLEQAMMARIQRALTPDSTGWNDLHRAAASGDEVSLKDTFASARWLLATEPLPISKQEISPLGHTLALRLSVESALGESIRTKLAHGGMLAWYQMHTDHAQAMVAFLRARQTFLQTSPADGGHWHAAWLAFERGAEALHRAVHTIMQSTGALGHYPLSPEKAGHVLAVLDRYRMPLGGLHIANAAGDRPLDLALRHGQEAAARLLIANGAPIHHAPAAGARWAFEPPGGHANACG